jgi:hypothetical protein
MWFEMMGDVGFEDALRELSPELLDRLFDPNYLRELSEYRPETALRWIRLARQMMGHKFSRRFDSDVLMRMFHPRHLRELLEHNPEAARAWIQLAFEVGGENFVRRIDSEFLEMAFHPRQIFELIEQNPETALVWIEFAHRIIGDGFLRHMEPEFVERAFHPRLFREKPAALAVVLRVARLAQSPRTAAAVTEMLMSMLHQTGVDYSLVGSLPISAISDVAWLANETQSAELQLVIRNLATTWRNAGLLTSFMEDSVKTQTS